MSFCACLTADAAHVYARQLNIAAHSYWDESFANNMQEV